MEGKAIQCTVLFLDDEPEITRGIQLALRGAPYTLFTAQSPAEAFALLRSRSIDVVVSDERMPGMSGTEFLARVKVDFPRTARILLTGHATLAVATKAINDGRITFLLEKPCPPERLVDAIAEALAGMKQDSSMGGETVPRGLAVIAGGFPDQAFQTLSAREREILGLIVDGQRLSQIARQLFISEHTARNHLKVIFRKLDAHSQVELIRKGREGKRVPREK